MILTRQFFSDPSYRCCRLAKKERCEEGAAFGMGRGASRETFTPVQRVSFFIIICVCFNVQTTYVYLFSNFLIFKGSLSHFFLSCLVIYCALSVFFPSVSVFVGNFVSLPLSDTLPIFLSVFFLCKYLPYLSGQELYIFSFFLLFLLSFFILFCPFFYCSCFLSYILSSSFFYCSCFFSLSFLPPFFYCSFFLSLSFLPPFFYCVSCSCLFFEPLVLQVKCSLT